MFSGLCMFWSIASNPGEHLVKRRRPRPVTSQWEPRLMSNVEFFSLHKETFLHARNGNEQIYIFLWCVSTLGSLICPRNCFVCPRYLRTARTPASPHTGTCRAARRVTYAPAPHQTNILSDRPGKCCCLLFKMHKQQQTHAATFRFFKLHLNSLRIQLHCPLIYAQTASGI